MINKITRISRIPFIIAGIFYAVSFITGLIGVSMLHIQKEHKKKEIEIKDSQHKNKVSYKTVSKPTNRPQTNAKSQINMRADKKVLARITVYWAYGKGTDAWSANKQSSTGIRLECGKHAAVDPKVIPYGSKLQLKKNGKPILVKAVDTGSAVKKRKAAIAMAKTPQQMRAPVVDLFFENKSDALAYANTHPPYQWVDVQLPQRN